MNREGKPVSAQEPEEQEADLGDLLRGLFRTVTRGRWYVLVPLAVITVVASQYALRLPNRYVSEATVGVAQQQVSDRYVASDVVPITEAVIALRQEVLSRASLLRIIEELDLYGDRSQASPEDLAARLQADLTVDVVEARRDVITALSVSFGADSPQVAQKVTRRVTDAFIQENRKQSGDRVQSTNEFLNQQVRDASAKLADMEARLQNYKSRNMGQLPEQQGANSAMLSDLRSRLRLISPDIERVQRSLRSVESQVSDKLAKLQSDRADLMRRFTAQNPAVVKQDAEIAKYTALRELFSTDGPSARARQLLAGGDDAQIGQIRKQAEDYTNDIDQLRKEQADLESQIRDYDRRVSAAPLREQEQSALTRDYELLKKDYETLKESQLKSGVSTDLAQREDGQRFRLVEPASLPLRPSGPNRLRLALGGAAVGLLIGLVLAFVRGSADSTFASEKEVARTFSVPLVLGIPEILTPREQSSQTRKKVFEWVAGTALALVVLSTEVYMYVRG